MSSNKRRLSNHPEAVLTCALLASAASASPAAAATAAEMNGGGGTLDGAVLSGTEGEFALFNASAVHAVFGSFWMAGSGAAQKGFIYNDLTCDIDAFTGANGGACAGPDGGANNTVDYAALEDTILASQISSWATSSFGQAAAGDLIQIPAFGIAPAIVVNDTNMTKNGKLKLSDNDLCGIFSGAITNFNQITDATPKPTPGEFKLVYRTDASGLTFLLTDHLTNVCNAGNTNPGIAFSATQTFASLFSGGINAWIPNAVGESGDAGVANYLSGLSDGAVPQALGYVSTGWTSLYPESQTALSNGEHSTLLVAALNNGGTPFLPTNANVAKGLLSPDADNELNRNVTPPATASEGANPSSWVPVTPVVTTGYPIVGYTEFLLPQCYHTAAVDRGMIIFLKDHYGNKEYRAIQAANGFVTLLQVTANGFFTAIEDNMLANDNGWNDEIDSPTACSGLLGR